MIWLEKALVMSIHDRQLSEHGGTGGMRDENLLESALARPQQLHAYGNPAPDLAALAASLAFGISRNHPFLDGNKRTAYTSFLTFIALNGGELVAGSEQKYLNMLALAEGRMSEAEFAQWLRDHIRLQSDSIQEPAATYKA